MKKLTSTLIILLLAINLQAKNPMHWEQPTKIISLVSGVSSALLFGANKYELTIFSAISCISFSLINTRINKKWNPYYKGGNIGIKYNF